MTAAEDPNRRLMVSSVDGFRGLTMLALVITHYVPPSFFSFNLAKPVVMLLVLTAGYFLASVMLSDARHLDGPGRFGAVLRLAVMRHVRVWPAIAGVVGLYILLAIVDGGPLTGQILDTWPLYLSYLGNLPKIWFGGEAWPGHFWVIAAQEQLILFLMLLISLVGLGPVRRMLWWFVGLGVMARLIGALLYMPANPSLALETPLAIADALALGMIARFAVANHATRTRVRRIALASGLALLLVWSMLPNTNSVYFTLVPLAAALLGCALITTLTDELRAARLHRFFAHPMIVLLGSMSLSLFLTHPLVNTVINLLFAKLTGVAIPWWLLLLVGPPASLLFGFLYFRIVETPIRRWRGRLMRPASGTPGRQRLVRA